jgi:hypothetical protein
MALKMSDEQRTFWEGFWDPFRRIADPLTHPWFYAAALSAVVLGYPYGLPAVFACVASAWIGWMAAK